MNTDRSSFGMHTTLHLCSALLTAVLKQNDLMLCGIMVFSCDQLDDFFPLMFYLEHQLC